jgi:hypothetical protein
MDLEKTINIVHYNFNLFHYHLNRLIIIYCNPFTWLSNFSKIKLGRKIFFENLVKNYVRFDHFIKYDKLTKLYFSSYITFVFSFLIVALLSLLRIKINLVGLFVIISVFSFVISKIVTEKYIFENDKFINYQQEFYKSKEYNFTFLFVISTIILFILDVYLISISY